MVRGELLLIEGIYTFMYYFLLKMVDFLPLRIGMFQFFSNFVNHGVLTSELLL